MVFRKKHKIVILGAGCAGLAASLRLLNKGGYEVSIFEQDTKAGGLCSGVEFNNNTYEYGPHLFHTLDQDILRDIEHMAGDVIFPVQRTVLVNFLGNYFDFPLSAKNVLFKLPLSTIISAFFSFIFYSVKGNIFRPRVETAETVLIRAYGKKLYEIFFKSYITRVWGIPPSEFSPKFATQRIPSMAAMGWLLKFISNLSSSRGKNIKTDDYIEKVEGRIYTTKKGFSGIIDKITEEITKKGGHIYLGKQVTALNCKNGRISHVVIGRDSEIIDCDGVISTIPINNMFKIIKPSLPSEFIKSAEKLKFRSLVFVGLLVKKARALPASFLYFREHSFNRIMDLSYFGFEIKPEGHTLLVAEISCSVTDRFWRDDDFCKRAVIDDLIKENLISPEMIKDINIYRSEYAYPIYELGFEAILNKLINKAGSIDNLAIAGRQGRFQYINSHIAIKMGYEAADKLEVKLNSKPLGQTFNGYKSPDKK